MEKVSRSYEMCLKIKNYETGKAEAIQKVAEEFWPFEEEGSGWEEWESIRHSAAGEKAIDHYLSSSAQASLCGGESEEKFADKLALAIWQANGGNWCEVEVQATYLDNLPFETHVRDEAAYIRLLKSQR